MLYFAYGSNMDRAEMAMRCPGAMPLGSAVLAGHALDVNADGYVVARSAPGCDLPGILWRLDPRLVAILDRYELIDAGWYRRAILTVRGNGTARLALVYLAGRKAGRGAARRDHLLRVVIGSAASWGLPASHLKNLHRLGRAGLRP
jgi:hypothetical protein